MYVENKEINKKYIGFISLIGVLFILLSYFVITLQVYYELTNITNIILNTVLIISGVIINIIVIKLLKLDEKLLENINLLKIYLIVVVIFVNVADWLIQNVFDYFKVINYLPLSFFVGFAGGILASFYLIYGIKRDIYFV
ncbi:hypothetical protein [Methanothermococcus okinawensis]|uniref:Uncharacterized protein n=1 Tax=Methanothermococcus okinawensis (strain DSM 14208 / JCM 11175 / IH1) TaxID=647113 RepID=F8AL18_METOI|nr:hypothetical protein [Methanothermococcus okinawensis]AEH06453.1 hypothetical protein Metok_0471 [Methanothermococcus okinawensis IH1]